MNYDVFVAYSVGFVHFEVRSKKYFIFLYEYIITKHITICYLLSAFRYNIMYFVSKSIWFHIENQKTKIVKRTHKSTHCDEKRKKKEKRNIDAKCDKNKGKSVYGELFHQKSKSLKNIQLLSAVDFVIKMQMYDSMTKKCSRFCFWSWYCAFVNEALF